MPEETNVDSFVLRFVREGSAAEGQGPTWRGIIRHVQSNRVRPFTRWADALTFICEYVDLREESSHE